MVTAGQPHPGCICREGWTGDHCELKRDPFVAVPKLQEAEEGGGNQVAGWVLFSILIAAMAAVVLGIIVIVAKARRERRGPGAMAVGKTAAEVGAGDLEMDGSGTLGVDSITEAEKKAEDSESTVLASKEDDVLVENTNAEKPTKNAEMAENLGRDGDDVADKPNDSDKTIKFEIC